MPETPHKVRAKVDDAIHELNANWDLQLPRLHGRDAEAAQDTSQIAKRCSGRLHYLSFRVDSFDGLLKDFDSDARKLYSKWTMKPAQEKGTLPVLPVTKSFLYRNVTRRRILGLNKLTKDQRDKLLELLDNTLKDDFDLARTSDSFQRTSTNPSRAPSRAVSATRRHSPRLSKFTSPLLNTPQQDEASISLPAAGKVPLQPTKMTRKRGSGEPTGGTVRQLHDVLDMADLTQSKRQRSEDSRQRKLTFGRRPSSSSIPTQPPQAQSFNTTASSSPSQVFDTGIDSRTSSTATSILETEQSTGYFATRNDAGLWDSLAPEENTSSVAVSFSAEDIPEKLLSTFVIPSNRLPTSLPFEYLYELQSLSYSWNVDPLDLFKRVEKLCRVTVPSADERWEAFKKLKPARAHSAQYVFGRAWSTSRGSSPVTKPSRSIYLTAALEWTTKASDPTLFKVKLQGPTTDKSCRFHRIWGGDRFLTLQVPFTQRGDLPSHLRNHADRLHNEVVQWLASVEHTIAGRQWRAFWVDDGIPKPTKDRPSFNKVHLFAIRGVGLGPGLSLEQPNRGLMTIQRFINQHVPIAHNKTSTNLKLFARFKLGLSKTTPTTILKKEQFRVVPDKISSDGNVMNDGCALMSPALARDIARHLGLSEIPTAFQGRISGAKGLWDVDYKSIEQVGKDDFWIEVSPSQLKVLPHPATRDACDEYRQFEVTDWSRPPQQSSLNTQFLTVLADRGVPFEVLENCQREHIHQYYYTDLCEAMIDPRCVRSWIHQYHRTPRNNDEVESSGAFPRDRTEKINMLLDAGFHPQDRYSPTRELLSGCLKDYLNWWADKLKITVMNESTFLYCVPDPYDVLGEGEVHCGLSLGWTSRTGIFSLYVAGMDGLVARNPANHPSDVQRIKLVFRPELQGFRDVMIFSTKGQRSLASRLSGGDYDGDQCWLCWRQDIVSSFVNYSPGPPDHITTQSCGLIERAERLTTIIPNDDLNAYSATAFLSGCFDFNLKPSMVGICTNEHEKVVYHRSLQDEGAIKLAALAAFLVDARKQGLELTDDVWRQIRAQCSGQKQLTKPAYKDADAVTKFKESNIVDRLRFRVATVVVEKALKHFYETWPRGLDYDLYFASISITAWNRAEKNKNKSALSVLKKLREEIQGIVAQWQQLTAGSRADDNPGNHPQFIALCFEQYKKIEPLEMAEEDDIHRRYDDENGRRFSYWNLLRASCFYREFHARMFTWYMIGEELCFLQAERIGGMRSVAGPMFAVTKIDGRAVRGRMATSLAGDSNSFDTSFGSRG